MDGKVQEEARLGGTRIFSTKNRGTIRGLETLDDRIGR